MYLLNGTAFLILWCRGWDLNPHGVTRLILSQVRLPFRHSGIKYWNKINYTILYPYVKGYSAYFNQKKRSRPRGQLRPYVFFQ